MVPLRSDYGVRSGYGEANTTSWSQTRRRPPLVLCDTTAASVPAAPRTHPRRKLARRWETISFSIATCAVLLFFVVTFVGFLWHSVAAGYESSLVPAAPVVSLRVVPGDTLWKYAARYGDPNRYILDRVESIARDNHIPAASPLIPGQTVRIAVHNPAEIAKLQRRHQARVASLSRF